MESQTSSFNYSGYVESACVEPCSVSRSRSGKVDSCNSPGGRASFETSVIGLFVGGISAVVAEETDHQQARPFLSHRLMSVKYRGDVEQRALLGCRCDHHERVWKRVRGQLVDELQ